MSFVLDDNGFKLLSKGQDGARAIAQHRARTERRYHLRHANGLYLHWSGTKLTDDKKHAWIGYASQRDCIRRSIALAAGLRSVGA